MSNEERNKRIVKASILGIIVNLTIAVMKIIVGYAISSLSIISEGLNNATDAGSSFLTLAGTKLSAKHPDKDHPFGYGRIEYLTSLFVAILILYTGAASLISSLKGLFHPGEIETSVWTIGLVVISALIKFFLGSYVIKVGKETESGALSAVGKEGRNDSFFSFITVIVFLIYILFHYSLDAIGGIIFSAVIIKSGFETLMDTLSELIGRPGKKELADKLYKEIRRTKGILNAEDLMLHNYGPNRYSGSVNIEIDYKENIGDIYEYIHELQLRLMHEYKVTMVFGIYAVNNDECESRELRRYIVKFVRSHEHLLGIHALYKSKATNKIYCDFVVDYDLQDWEQLEKEFIDYMKIDYPSSEVELTIETEFI